MIRRPFAAVLLLLAACGGSSAVPAAAPPPPAPTPAVAPPRVEPAPAIRTGPLAAAVAAKQSKGLRASVGVYDVTTGDVLYEANADVARRPASCMKVATTAAALLALGPKAELATEVLAGAKPDADGRIDGDLVVRGGGDPAINNRVGFGKETAPGQAEATLHAMAKAVRAAGVRRVTGDLLLDDTSFSGPIRRPDWDGKDDQWAWFKAPVSSLLLTDACVELTVAPGASEGAAAVLKTDPPTKAVRFVDRVVTASASSKKTNVALGRVDASGAIPVTGDVPMGSPGFRTQAACVDPVDHFGDVFLRVLREEGVEISGKAVARRNPGAAREVSADSSTSVMLARHAISVGDVVRIANKRSQNLYAELLLRAVGRSVEGEGSFEGGCRAVRKTLGFDPSDATFVQVDGSGLSRENQVTVGALGKILVRMFASPAGRDFVASLPGAAEPDSTLRKRFGGAKYENRIYAKTGSLRDTSSLAGYVKARSGRTLVFAVLCEGEVGRAHELQDDVVEALVEQ